MERNRKPRPTYASIKESLACANSEAQDYLERLSVAEKELQASKETLREWVDACSSQQRLIGVLVRALEDLQKKS